MVGIKESVEIMPDVRVEKKALLWFINKLFDPESSFWIWIRRFANLVTFVIFILVLYIVFRVS